MITAKLKRIEPLRHNAELTIDSLDEGSKTFQVIEIQPGPSKRYMISIEVGDMPPKEAHAYLMKVREQLKGFFPDGSYLVSPMRKGQPTNGIYEIDIK